ncbi:MAG: hypothetical protein WD906_04755 [Anaerolineales bacterium]
MLLGGIGAALFGVAFQGIGRPTAYALFHATASPTHTPTITGSPSITMTPSVTLIPTISATPTITPTSTVTPTPILPDAVAVLLVHDQVTPSSDAVFSPIQIARVLDRSLVPISPAEEFENPIGALYAAFTYDLLQDGVRWTALWYRGVEVVCLETQAWESGTGGYGFSECSPTGGWAPGAYEVQMFYAERWIVSARFQVHGAPPTRTATVPPSPTSAP